MGQTALKKDEELLEVEEVPEGGIGDFAMSDEDFAVLEAEEAEKQVGSEGIGNVVEFSEVSKRMASLGRYGDDMVVHVETGELVVPRRLIEQSPELKESIFSHLREQGITDPERYVVGSSENSINPETGLMEFGFFSKLFKSVKKVFKKVGKALKKAAHIILPIVGTAIFGPIWGAAMGSGIATLVQGGNLKDAFKSALLSGATGALATGVSGAMGGGTGSFVGNVQAAGSLGNVSQGFANIGNAITGQGGSPVFSFDNMVTGPEATALTPAEITAQATAQAAPVIDAVPTMPDGAGGTGSLGGSNMQANLDAANTAISDSMTGTPITEGVPQLGTGSTGGVDPSTLPAEFSQDVGFKEYMTQAGKSDFAVQEAQQAAADRMAASLKSSTMSQAAKDALVLDAFNKAGPGMLAKFGPSALAGTALMGATGMFDVPPMEDPGILRRNADGSVTTGEDLLRADPRSYMVSDLGSAIYDPYGQYGGGSFTAEDSDEDYDDENPSSEDLLRNEIAKSNVFKDGFASSPVLGFNEGGEIFPRRNGGIMPNEGVANEDSVRALLMPGEFVMTTDAVKGLGNGSQTKGIKNMYDVMRNLERRGRAMA